MIILRTLVWLLKAIGGLLALLLVVLVVLSVFEIPISLAWIKTPIESLAGKSLGAKVKIEGGVIFTPSLSPSLEVKGLRILGSQSAASQNYVSLGMLRAQLKIVPLFSGNIHVVRLEAEQVEINLTPGPPSKSPPPSGPTPSPARTVDAPGSQDQTSGLRFAGINNIRFRQVAVRYQPQGSPGPTILKIDQLNGAWPAGESLELSIKGMIQKQSYALKLTGGSLADLRTGGQTWAIGIKGSIAGVPLNARAQINPSDSGLDLGLEIQAEKVDLGRLLAWLKLAEGVEASVGKLGINLGLRGNNLDEILTQYRLTADLEQGRWVLRDPNTKADVELIITKGQLRAEPAKPITLKLDVRLDDTPFKLAAQWARVKQARQSGGQVPLEIQAQGAAISLNLRSKVRLPMKLNTLDLAMNLKVKHLHGLERLLNVDLPQLGPFTARGRFRMMPSGYRLSDLGFELGTSRFTGEVGLDTSGKRPNLRVTLTAKKLQIEDFYLPERRKKKEAASPGEVQEKLRSFFSPAVMQSFDTRLLIEVQRVVSGKDHWGNGSLLAEVKDGRLSFKPLRINLPGGEIKLTLAYKPGPEDFSLQTTAFFEDFDYGLLARMLDPKTKMRGFISLDLRLDTRAKVLAAAMDHADGRLDFALVPVDFQAGLIDLWAVNLLQAVFKGFGREKESKINCMVAQLDLKDGVMTQRRIVLDTTQMRVQGEAKIDFGKKRLACLFTPEPKTPQFLSLATPLSITGSFSKYKVGIARGGLLGTVLQTLSSPLHVPLRKIFQQRVPADGRDVCGKPLQREPDVMLEPQPGDGRNAIRRLNLPPDTLPWEFP